MIENDMKNLERGLPLKTWWITNGDRLLFREWLTQCRCPTSWHIKATDVCFVSGFDFYLYLLRFPSRIIRVANAHSLRWCKNQFFHRMRVIEPYHNSKSWSIFMHSHMIIFIQKQMMWRDWTQPNFLLLSHTMTSTSNTLFKVNNPHFRL